YHLLFYLCRILFFFLLTRPPPGSTLFPYTTLFRSLRPRSSRRRVRAWSPAARIALANISLCPCRRLGIDPHGRRRHSARFICRYERAFSNLRCTSADAG